MPVVSTAVLATALGYILKGVSDSKTLETAKEDLLGGFWNWIRPLFLRDDPQLEKHLQQRPDDEQVQQKALDKLAVLAQDPQFAATLQQHVTKLQRAGIKEKNVLVGSIKGIKGNVHVGDKTANPNEAFDRKNIIEGNVEDVGGDFRLGDG